MCGTQPPAAPGARPLVGHTVSFLRDPLGSLERWGRTDAAVVRARIAGRAVRLITTPRAAREVLATDADAYRKAEIVRERLGTLQGGSLVLLEGEAWRERRRTLRSGFTADRVATAGELTTRYATETVASWPDGDPIRADEHARDLSLAVLARALFGLDLRGERTPIHRAADDILARMDLGSVSTYLPEWVPTPTNRRFRRAIGTLHDRLDATVERRAADDGSGTDLLSTMLAAGLSRDEVRDELIALLFAGFDSTATALSCALGLVADHPGVRASLRDELDTVLDGDPPTPAHLPDLPLLDAVVRESLRLYPPQYLLFREPTEPVTLQDYEIAPGTMVVVSPWILHRDDRFWDDPGTFDPSRWLDDTGRPEHAYLPYGAGPRHCLGRRLADQTLRLVLAVICRRRRLEPVDGISVAAGPTLSLDGGVTLRAHR
jgi:cytochrome P450